jgi:hypothetical protein
MFKLVTSDKREGIMGEIENEKAVEQKPQEDVELHDQYKKLNKGLLYLLAGELGYFILMIILVIIFSLIPTPYSDHRYSGPLSATNGLFPWALIPLFIGFAGNLFGGIASLYLTIKKDPESFPGAGHFLNWMFILTTCWIFMAMLVILAPSVGRNF